jgi:hypothetical protein
MERVLKFDFSELRLLFMIERGLPSLNHIIDSDFISWCEHEIEGLGIFRDKLSKRVWKCMSAQQKNMAKNNGHVEERVPDPENKVGYVVKDNTIITVLTKG